MKKWFAFCSWYDNVLCAGRTCKTDIQKIHINNRIKKGIGLPRDDERNPSRSWNYFPSIFQFNWFSSFKLRKPILSEPIYFYIFFHYKLKQLTSSKHNIHIHVCVLTSTQTFLFLCLPFSYRLFAPSCESEPESKPKDTRTAQDGNEIVVLCVILLMFMCFFLLSGKEQSGKLSKGKGKKGKGKVSFNPKQAWFLCTIWEHIFAERWSKILKLMIICKLLVLLPLYWNTFCLICDAYPNFWK